MLHQFDHLGHYRSTVTTAFSLHESRQGYLVIMPKAKYKTWGGQTLEGKGVSRILSYLRRPKLLQPAATIRSNTRTKQR